MNGLFDLTGKVAIITGSTKDQILASSGPNNIRTQTTNYQVPSCSGQNLNSHIRT